MREIWWWQWSRQWRLWMVLVFCNLCGAFIYLYRDLFLMICFRPPPLGLAIQTVFMRFHSKRRCGGWLFGIWGVMGLFDGMNIQRVSLLYIYEPTIMILNRQTPCARLYLRGLLVRISPPQTATPDISSIDISSKITAYFLPSRELNHGDISTSRRTIRGHWIWGLIRVHKERRENHSLWSKRTNSPSISKLRKLSWIESHIISPTD